MPTDHTANTGTSEGAVSLYDVVVMGGGPAGSTLAALLARQTKLKIAIVEKDFFPREHIGESFSHRVTSVLEESGALPKVLASDCWVKKFGGYYAWDPEGPAATLFDPLSFERDGALRWSIHVNRSEFDDILLGHARDLGVEVLEGTSVTAVVREGGTSRVELSDGSVVRCRIFVEASGRATAIVTGEPKAFLSQYKNIAIWNHVVGGRKAQSLAGDWNIFRQQDLSPIGNFAFEDGWFWYIPVPKMIMGERRLTHSLGMVTDPRILKEPGKRYTDPARLLEKAREVPYLKELVADAELVSDKVLTATNYSMISPRFCDHDEGWMLVGDAAYFVDPLFSSGVAFAMMHASSAASVIRFTLEDGLPEPLQREMWSDYDRGWQGIARSFALSIDQWYHAIATNHPTSIYWKSRARAQIFDVRSRPFQALVDTGIAPDLLRVLSKGTDKVEDIGQTGPLVEALSQIRSTASAAGQKGSYRLKANVAIKESVTVDPARGKAVQSRDPNVPVDPAAARYWTDPVKYAGDVPPSTGMPRRCHRFHFSDEPRGAEVRFDEAMHRGVALYNLLAGGPRTDEELSTHLSPSQRLLLTRLQQAGMVELA